MRVGVSVREGGCLTSHHQKQFFFLVFQNCAIVHIWLDLKSFSPLNIQHPPQQKGKQFSISLAKYYFHILLC